MNFVWVLGIETIDEIKARRGKKWQSLQQIVTWRIGLLGADKEGIL